MSNFGARLNVTSSKLVDKELGLLCEDMEIGSLWKLRFLPVVKVLRQANISPESDIDYKQLRNLLNKSWIDDEFDKQLRKLERGKMLEMQKSLQVNTLVVIDRALENMLFESTQFVKDFFPLVNHLLGSIRIEINITDILLEDSRRFGFIAPLDNNKTNGIDTFKELLQMTSQDFQAITRIHVKMELLLWKYTA